MTEPIDVVEALLFASETPVEPDRIREVLELGSPGSRPGSTPRTGPS